MKKEVENVSMEFCELTDEELAQVFGGIGPNIYVEQGDDWDKEDINGMLAGEQGGDNMNINQNPQSLNEQLSEKASVIDLTHF